MSEDDHISQQILIVEDNSTEAALLQHHLQQLGFSRIVWAGTTKDALAAVRRTHVDLALVDIMLEQRDEGIDLARIFQQDHKIPVIFMSGYSDEGTINRAKQVDPYGYLLKPITKGGLITTLEVALHRSQLDRQLGQVHQELAAAHQALTREMKERKRAEAASRESEIRWQAVTDTAPDAIFLIDREGRFLYVNAVIAQNFKCTPQDLIGKKESDLVPADISDRHLKWIQQVLDHREQLIVDDHVQLPIGEIWFETRLVPLEQEGASPLVVLGISRDITSRYLAHKELDNLTATLEEQVKKRTYHLEVLSRLSMELGFAPNYDQLFRIMMTPLAEVVEYDIAASLVNSVAGFNLYYKSRRPMSDDIRKHIARRLITAYNMLDNNPNPQPLVNLSNVNEIFFDETDPALSPLNALGSSFQVPLIVGPEKRVSGILFVGTEKKQFYSQDHIKTLYHVANQATDAIERLDDRLQEEKSRLVGIIENLPHGILILDQQNRLIMMNSVAVQPLTLLSDTRQGEELTCLGTKLLSEFLENNPQKQWTDEIRINGENPKVFEVIGRRLFSGPFSGGLLIAIRDVTEESLVSEKIQQQERLAAVGQLAAGIAHDFNNLLTSIGGYSEMIANDDRALIDIRHKADVIRTQVRRAAQLIRQILDFSRKSISKRFPLELISFLKEAQKLLERTIRENVKIDFRYERGDYVIQGDPVGLQQVVTNLAINAQDAMPEGGVLSIHLDQISLTSYGPKPFPEMRNGNYVKMVVIDTGEGMPPEVVGKIFDPFFTTKPMGKGTGLGLSQAMGIIRAHDGFIDVQSRPGQGTTFRIFLPLIEPERDVQKALEVMPVEKGRKETILLVEDEEVVREMGKNILENIGYEVIAAGDGDEAIALFRRHRSRVALVLTDLVMPKMGGKALIDEIKKIDPSAKIIAWTGYPLEDENEALRLDIFGWIMKPPNIPELTHMIRQAIKPESRQRSVVS